MSIPKIQRRLLAIALTLVIVILTFVPAGARPSSPDANSLAAMGNPPRSLLSVDELQSAVLVPIATDLDRPVAITNAGDGSGRLFFTLQLGQIVIYDGSQVLPTPFLDITELVMCCGEQGLLSVAFHPQYAANGLFYVNYTDITGGDTIVAQYSVSGDPNVADPGSAVILFEIDQPYHNHNGGGLQFGPDDYLYIGMGDGGSGGDPENRAQNLQELLGKMLRIDVNPIGGDAPDCGGGANYSIPPDNPFVDGAGGNCDEIWAYGMRNPWRFTFDRMRGDLFIADVGQNFWEEVDYQLAASSGGENYGWRLMEGPACFNPPVDCNDGTLTLPIIAYPHEGGGCAVIGGYRYRGTLIPEAFGRYFFADHCTGQIWTATPRQGGGRWRVREFKDTDLFINAFGEDEAGELCLAHYVPIGTIYCLLPAQ